MTLCVFASHILNVTSDFCFLKKMLTGLPRYCCENYSLKQFRHIGSTEGRTDGCESFLFIMVMIHEDFLPFPLLI